MRKFIETSLGVVSLLLVAGLFLLPYLRGEAYPLDLSYAATLAPWTSDTQTTPSVLSKRHVEETAPTYMHLAGIRDAGDGLLWNPMDGLGAPFLAQWHTRALSPFSAPVYILGLQPGLGVSVWLKLAVAALTAFYVARRFGLRPPIAVGVAALYMLSPALMGGLAEPLADALPWMPMVLLAAERLALRQKHAWPTLGLATLLITLAGHPPALTGVALFLLVYIPLRARGQAPGERLAHLLPATVAMLLGVTAATAQLWPYIEYLGQTHSGEPGFQPTLGLNLPSILLPTGSTDLNVLNFAGFLPFLLLPLWWIMRPFMDATLRIRTDLLLLLGLSGLLLAGLCGDATLAPWFDASVFLVCSGLALAFVIGAIAEEWLLLTAEQVRDSLPMITRLVPICWVVWLIVLLGVAVTTGAWASLAAALLIALLTFGLFAFTLFRPTAGGLGYGLVFIAAVSSSLLTAKYMPSTPVAEAFNLSAFGKDLQKGELSRIAGSGELKSWPLSVLGVQQCFAPNTSGLARLAAFETAATETPLLLRRTGADGLLLTKEDIRGDLSDIRPLLHTKAVFEQGAILFEDASMTARARVIYAGKRAEKSMQLPEKADSLPLLEGGQVPEDGELTPGSATVDVDSPSEIRISIPKTPPGILVLADMWYPGWTATIDGMDTPVFPVDGIFRGIEVGDGAHEAVFRYQPMTFEYGLMISAVAGIILLMGLWRTLSASE